MSFNTVATMTNSNPPMIKKASGDFQEFDINKLKRSLERTGVKGELLDAILDDINKWIVDGVTTKQIYKHAYDFLEKEKEKDHTFNLYQLKQALFEIGPSGYPFESLIGELFNKQGYETEVGVVVDGRSITHEMDVIATNQTIQHLVECKYSRDQGGLVSIQVPLYVRSRVNDIVAHRIKFDEFKGLDFRAWVVTNTRFSNDSKNYGKANEMSLLAWDYPEGAGLKEKLQEYKVYPISILHHLDEDQKTSLMKQGIVTITQLLNDLDVVKFFNLSDDKFSALLKELNTLDP